MTKINFVNGQQPSLNQTNLNGMQNNIETAINGTTLYETTTTGFNITLLNHSISEDISHFDEFVVYFKRGSNIWISPRIKTNQSNIVVCHDFGTENEFVGRLQVLGTTASWLSSKSVPISGGTIVDTDTLYCVKIVGYKL